MRMLNKYKDFLSVKDLCEILGIGKNTAYRLLKNDEIKSIRIGNKYKIPKEYLLGYLQILQTTRWH